MGRRTRVGSFRLAFSEAVLPRRAWGCGFVTDAHGSHSVHDGGAVDPIPVTEGMPPSRCTLTLASPVAENTPTGQLGLAKAWRRGKLLPKVKASMLLGLLSEFGPVRDVPGQW
jgi:hypothetical protein